MTLWICKLTESGGQIRLTIPKGLVKLKKFLKVGYVQLEDKYPDIIIIKGVKIDGEKTIDRKINTTRKDR
jgi:hypothetical protein